MDSVDFIEALMKVIVTAKKTERAHLSSMAVDDISEDDIVAVENKLGCVSRGAWGAVNHRELILACVKVVCEKVDREAGK